MNLEHLDPRVLIAFIPILAIVAGIVLTVTKHRERMAMIERGMNPDQVKLDAERARTQLPPNDIRR